jgi:anti-sigma factor (TIGR02949 family)
MTLIQFDEAVCRKIRARLNAYLNDELSVESAAEVDRHLKSCAKCSDELAEMEGLRTRLRRGADAEPIPEGLREAVSARLGREYRRRSAPWLAVAAALVLIVGGGSLITKKVTGFLPHQFLSNELQIHRLLSQVASAYAPAIIDHLRCAIFGPGPDSAPTPEKIAKDLGEQAPIADIVKQAAGPDATLMVAHRCVFGGREFVHMVLVENGSLISVVLTKKREGEALGAEPEATSAASYQIAGFEAGGYLAFVISDLTPEKNTELARNLVSPVRRFLG